MNFEYYLDLHQKGNLSEAEKGYRKLLKKEKNNSVLLTSLGLICLKTDKDEEPSEIKEETEKPHLYIHTDNKKNFQIAVNGRFLAILNIQLEGKKSMNIQQFLQGNKIDNNATIS